MALTLTITDAGRAALINEQNTGTNAMVIDRVGISSSHAAGNLKALTVLPNERKRLTTFGGEVVADDVLHVTVTDTSDDTYSLHAFGLYFSTGVLFAVCTSPERIMEKSASAMLLQSVDITLKTLDTALIEFGPAGFTNPPATIDRMGVVELATTEETLTGTDTTRAVTPFSLGRVLAQWANAFAPKAHGHSVSDISDLGTTLANKSDKSHRHDAGDTTSGTFSTERIPKLAISWITNLAETLADKAAKLHQHHADDIAQGVLAVGRIPALAMEKITGLANALATKATLGVNAVFRDVIAGRDPVTGVYYFGTEAGQWLAYANSRFELVGTGGLVINGYQAWTTQTFNPADKANALHSHDWSQITGKDDVVLTSATGLGRLNTGPLHTFASIADIVSKPTGYSAMMTNGSAGMPPYLGYFFKMATRDAGYGWQGLFATFVGTGEQTDLYVGSADQGHHTPVWSKLVSEANFRTLPLATPAASGLALLADNWQTQAGHDAGRAVTPAGLWSFAKSIGPNGYVQIPGTDLIIQWGVSTASVTEGLQHATLPVAFGGGCLVALANARNPSAVVQYDWYMQVHSKWLDRIIFYANKANDSSPSMQGFEWIAIGLAKGSPNPAYSGSSGGGGLPPGGGGGGGEYTPEV